MRAQGTFTKSSMSFALLSAAAILCGGARGCFGDESPESVGSDDAGMEVLDASIVVDAGMAIPDMSIAADAGIDDPDSGIEDPDAGTVVDAGIDDPDSGTVVDAGMSGTDAGTSHVYTWNTELVGHGDNDYSNPLVFDGLGNPHIVSHWETTGGVTYAHAVAGVWGGSEVSIGYYAGPPSYVSNCASYANLAGDSTGKAHIVYRTSELNSRLACSTEPLSGMEYVSVEDDTASAPLVIAEATTGYTPAIVVDAADVVHIIYRAGPALAYRTVDHGVLGTRSDIPDTDGVAGVAMFRKASGDLLIVYLNGPTVYRRVFHEGAWSTPEALPVDALASTAYDAATDTLHFARLTDRHYISGLEYMSLRHTTVSSSGTAGTESVIATEVRCRTATVALDSTGTPAIACGIRDVGVDFYARLASGGWSTAQAIRAPAGEDPPQSAVAALAFDHANRPHVAFQGWPGAQLYYASPR